MKANILDNGCWRIKPSGKLETEKKETNVYIFHFIIYIEIISNDNDIIYSAQLQACMK